VRIAFGKLARYAVFQHLRERAELAMTFPVIGQVKQIAGTLRKGFKALFRL